MTTTGQDEQVMALAGDFGAVEPGQWERLVAAVVNKSRTEDDQLAPEDAVDTLRTVLPGGVTLSPLYRPADVGERPLGLPGAMPFTRGGGPRDPQQPWDIRQLHESSDAEQTRQAVLTDLERGVTSVWLTVGEGALAPADLPGVLDGVLLDLAPVVVTSTSDQAAAARALADVLAAAPERAAGSSLGLDPIGMAAASGEAPDVGGLAPFVSEALVLGARAITVDARVYHDAGATGVEQIALAVATGVAYVRQLEDEGVDAADAFRAIEFRLSVTADQFASISELRALRRVWARVGELAGVPEEVRAARIHAVTSARMLTVTDPWVNTLRTTIAAFAASAGGAEAITVLPHDHPMGLPEPFSRRLARNTQSLLAFESHIARVADPAGGSWYVESLTDELARAAWARVGELDAAGGITAGLQDGSIAERLAQQWSERVDGLASRTIPLTGTSTFPLAGEQPLTREPRPTGPTGGLPRHRDGEVFEALRARAAEAPAAPTVLLISPGTRRDFGARQGFASNLLAVGGISADLHEGGDPASAADVARAGGHRVAMIATSRKVGAAVGAQTVAALREAGVEQVLIAGRASELGEGAHDVVEAREGVDVLTLLGELLDQLTGPSTDGDQR